MSVKYKALGGLIEFSFINKVEDLDLEGLQDLYNKLEEEFLDVEKDYKELKGELDKVKGLIDRKNPEERKEKIKEKQKTSKEILGNEDIPYEVRMKYIIDAYRKDQKKWGKLYDYAKHLEGEVIRLKMILIANGYADSGVVGDSEPAKVISELRTKLDEQKEKMKTLARDLRDSEIDRLKELIEKEYPLKTRKMKWIKDIVRTQHQYIRELQDLLDKNNIIYYPLEPADVKDMEELANAVDEKAVRILQDLNQVPKLK